MKKMIAFLILILVLTTGATSGDVQHDEMIDMAVMVTENDMSVDHWQVTIKEQMSADRIKQLVQLFQGKDSYLASRKEDENSINYLFRHSHKQGDIFETYSVIVPKNDLYKAQFIMIMKGEFWNKSVKEKYLNTMNSMKEKLFTVNSTKFACLTTSTDDIMKGVYFLNKLKESWNMQYIRKQTDNVEDSTLKKIVYGYTPMWNQKITMRDKPMNFQAAIKNDENGDMELTIGTPILITEY